MAFEVVVTEDAEQDLDRFLFYLVYEKRNTQAASNLLNNFERTKNSLKDIAGSLHYCDNERLKKLGYRRINFDGMDYFLLYRIVDNTVFIDNMFHFLQDYEHKMK